MSYYKLVEKIPSGLVTKKDKRQFTDFAYCKEKTIYQKSIKGHFGCVNALGIGADENFLASGGDDTRVFIWNIQDLILDEAPKPRSIMKATHFSNVFSTTFTPSGNLVISTANDSLVIVHDVNTGEKKRKYALHERILPISVYNSSVLPDSENIFIVCSDNPEISMYDMRVPEEKEVQSWRFNRDIYSVDFHPNGRMFVIAGRSSLGVIDSRNGKDIYNSTFDHWLMPKGATHAKWSPSGNGLAIVRPCNTPIYFDLHENTVTYLADSSGKYKTRNTVKACEFIDEDTLVTGSENFEIFMWHLSNAKECEVTDLPEVTSPYDQPHDTFVAHMAKPYTRLQGHRSIPNMMKYSPRNGVLFSSGVEKIIKTWTVYSFPGSTTSPNLRKPGDLINFRYRHHDQDESEDEEILHHFDELILGNHELSPNTDDMEEFSTDDDMFDMDSDEEETERMSVPSSPSPEPVPIRRMENGEFIVDCDSDEE